ncbi:MAG: hypothetical protein A3K10_04475 [Bacteroidetes bacterium RIFCSPLOWO2_12_FULL_31_6]|nr:MAG: hypothetical protein A3K10_04475 [Bacteroidetes bacterium RIFCSPLOWO2_12_FULL_31_6]
MKMIKYVFALVFAAMLYAGVQAQENPAPPTPPKPPKDMEHKKEMIEAMKTGFITRELDLSPEEAQKFWPIYNQYDNEMKTLQQANRKKMKNAKENFDQMADKDAELLVDDYIVEQQRELDIKKKYHVEFKKVLPIKKVGKLYHAEDKFKKELLERMKDQKPPMNPNQPKQPPMPDNQPGE